jgi:hypothetical protein
VKGKRGRSREQQQDDFGSIPHQSMWDLWWTKWHWDRVFPEYFGFPLSVSFHRCSITWKNEENYHLSFHLHRKGCTISLTTAVRQFLLLRGPSKKNWMTLRKREDGGN